MDQSREIASSPLFGPGVFVPYLMRVPLLVTLVLLVTLSDLAIPGSMEEALRYSILDQPHQLAVILVALLCACLAVRFTAEAMIELVSPDLYDGPHAVRLFAQGLPRLFSLALGIATAVPLLELALDKRALPGGPARLTALSMAIGCMAIGLVVSLLPKGPHAPTFTHRRTATLMRWIYALLPLLLAIAFAGAVLGVWQQDSGMADHALERYVCGIVGMFDDGSAPGGPLQSYMYDATGAPVLRYASYVRSAPYAVSLVSPTLIAAELISLLVSCIAARLGIAIFLDLTDPRLGSQGPAARAIRLWLPRLVSAGLGAALAFQMYWEYLRPAAHVALSADELRWVYGIAAAYLAIGLLGSLGSGSRYVLGGPWRDSSSVGRRFLGAARRLSSLDIRWKWIIGGLAVAAVAVFLLFADIRLVRVTQWIGPVAIILCWGFSAAVLFFPLAYLSHETRIPTLTILLLAGVTFAGFDLNNNHELRVVSPASHAGPASAAATRSDQRQDLDLATWLSTRADLNKYRQYPVFLVATEGGGIRAAYFTASVLAALQERCPSFAQHTIAVSGVSGGSVGAAVFAALASEHAKNAAGQSCNVAGLARTGPILARARKVLSADLLSPLLGAMLFPDALQRLLPVPIPAADRSRAIEYAIEDSWRKATTGTCGRCDPDRMAQRAADLYAQPPPFDAVPNLFLNTTEAGTGQIIPYASIRVVSLATPFRDKAEIDDGKFDFVEPSPSQIERLSLQDRMTNSDVPLSTAAIVSARFPYLTPAGSIGDSGGEYVDGGYFENSGTSLLSGLLQYLVGQQLSYPAGKSPAMDAARNAVFIVIVIQSEPCTRDSVDAGCAEDATTADDSWNELLSPVRALLSTRDMRAEYSYDSLNAFSSLIEQMSRGQASRAPAPDRSDGCDYPVCAVTLRFRNRTRTDIPLSWVLSSEGRRSMDNAVNGMERADVRSGPPPQSISLADDTQDIDRVLGSYRRILCMLATTQGSAPCTAPPRSAAARIRKARG